MPTTVLLQGQGHEAVMDVNEESAEMTSGGLLPQHGGDASEGEGALPALIPADALWPGSRGERPIGGEASGRTVGEEPLR